ncbi:MAG: AraC family transcriptional regulator [Methylophilaceae bacterium]
MQKPADWIHFEYRLNRVTDYIYAHLDDALDLTKLAEIAYLSPYHFHRIYRAARGETIFNTVQRLRLHRAANALAQTSLSIAAISEQAGYKNVQSFTRTFNTAYAMPPARYRAHGSHAPYLHQQQLRSTIMFNVTFTNLADIEVVCIKHIGAYLEIGQAFDRLGSYLSARQLISNNTHMLGVYFDDPSAVPAAELRSLACATVSQAMTLEAPLERYTIAGGECAVLRYQGPYSGLPAAYDWFYSTWLPQSGREMRDAPSFEEYLNTPMDTAPADLITLIHLPLK